MSYTVFILSFAISWVAVPSIKVLARNQGAVALPGRRHIHARPTPKFGGIAIALSVLSISFFIFPANKIIISYLSSSALMLLLGILDDVKETRWQVKLLISLAATTILILGGDLWVKSLGNMFGLGEIYLGLWGIPFTYFAVFGIINAINLIDGLNGLACGVASIAFMSFAVFAYMYGNETVFYLSLANLGATLGLLNYNYPKAKIFMGDSGSLFIGFSLSVLSIMLTQGSGKVSPMIPVIILGIPIFDTLRVMIVRFIHNKHPFDADKTHLHHLMVRSDLRSRSVVKRIWLLSLLMSLLAFSLRGYDEWIMFSAFIAASVFIGIYIENLKILKSARKNGRH
ncbi:MAG: undecaprenyl/decaprenyl-phosphate alpha-N-acetylglucosaminyl 1-phosphate transferase [Nitrospirae bacterium]|nr:undecaprenyl/decaprenyl-phosphate alpha-N-acetylglucosaminyl 1-phosphate transferase [Nitrospirota bacterium]